MRHRLNHRKLNKNTAARKALLRGLATELIDKGAISTTLERAKELRMFVEPLISRARKDTLQNRRIAASILYKKETVKHLFSSVAVANINRPGGYTRILRLGFRPGDHARRAVIEFVESSINSKLLASTETSVSNSAN